MLLGTLVFFTSQPPFTGAQATKAVPAEVLASMLQKTSKPVPKYITSVGDLYEQLQLHEALENTVL